MKIDEALALVQVRSDLRSGRARAIREAAGLSQAEIARSIGVERATVALWEQHRRIPHGDAALHSPPAARRARRGGPSVIAMEDAPKPPTTLSTRQVADSWEREQGGASSHGTYRRNHPDADPPAEPYRGHAAARLQAHICRVVAAAPPLTPEQRDRLAVLLRATPTGGDAA